MGILGAVKEYILRVSEFIGINKRFSRYKRSFLKYAFTDCKCKMEGQFEASIIRLYHTIEKGLSYKDYRPGFGKENVDKLIRSLEQYESRGYRVDAFFYETALSCLYSYILKNKEYGYIDEELEARINRLPGKPNHYGGTIEVSLPENSENMTYRELVMSRHSIRDFSDKPVSLDDVREALSLAQHTPSACNRQCWRTRVIIERKTIDFILSNQNGNRGFGHKIDKLLVITADLQAQQQNRELFQVYIDGGMYAESVLNALYCKGIGSIPLSASLSSNQEMAIRNVIGLKDSEVLILFVGIGNYPEYKILTTRSERKPFTVETI